MSQQQAIVARPDTLGRPYCGVIAEPTTAPDSSTSFWLSVATRLVPGIGRVHAQAAPFARDWQAANIEALRRHGPLWVAIGDSMSQGIGAHDISGGWVGQLHTRMTNAGHGMRLVNLSTTGARVRDVLQQQLPRLGDLAVEPTLITVLVGANDMLRRQRRQPAVEDFARLLGQLPPSAGRSATITVVATLPRRNRHALAINALIDGAASAGHLRVADLRGRTFRSLRGTLAEDHFHPNERGYAAIADAFAGSLGLVESHR